MALINKEVDQMHLSRLNAYMTRMALRFLLTRRAYGNADFERMVASTPFRIPRIEERGIGLDVWLTK